MFWGFSKHFSRVIRRPLLARGTKAAGLDLLASLSISGHANQLSSYAFMSLKGPNAVLITLARSPAQDPLHHKKTLYFQACFQWLDLALRLPDFKCFPRHIVSGTYLSWHVLFLIRPPFCGFRWWLISRFTSRVILFFFMAVLLFGVGKFL